MNRSHQNDQSEQKNQSECDGQFRRFKILQGAVFVSAFTISILWFGGFLNPIGSSVTKQVASLSVQSSPAVNDREDKTRLPASVIKLKD